MNLKQLETFVQIVQKGSFAAAAEALHTTQSTVSARIKDLEHYFGVQLFDRSAHRALLTEKGRQLFDLSGQLIGAMEDLRDRIADRGSLTGTLRLGVVGVVAGTWLPALVRELRARHPSIELQIEVALTKVLVRKLCGGQLDAAIVAGGVADDALLSEVVASDTFVWMASPSLGVASREATPAVLAGLPVIAFPAESHHYAVMKRWFGSAGIRFQPTITCNSMEVISRLVVQGAGVALLPSEYYGTELSLGTLEAIRAAPAIPRVEFTLLSFAQRQTALVCAVRDGVRSVRRRAR